jgi:hypothetical protein
VRSSSGAGAALCAKTEEDEDWEPPHQQRRQGYSSSSGRARQGEEQQLLPNPNKRVRLTPSSATGFIGLAEHRFLTTALEDFLYVFPFVDNAVVREVSVTMLSGLNIVLVYSWDVRLVVVVTGTSDAAWSLLTGPCSHW